MSIKSKIKSRIDKPVKKSIPADMKKMLKEAFGQYGGIAVLSSLSGLHRNTIKDVKKSWVATQDVQDKLKRAFVKL